MVTVKRQPIVATHRGVPLKSAKDRMNTISAYQQVGSYRRAAELCGTTHRTVKKVVDKSAPECHRTANAPVTANASGWQSIRHCDA